MKAVKPGEHIERCAKHTLLEGQTLVIGMHVFVRLETQKQNTQGDGQE